MTARFGWRGGAAVMGAMVLAMCASGSGTEGWRRVTPVPAGAGPTIRIVGTVRFLNLEGGVYVIADAQATRFNPTNLPVEFRTDGLAVEVDARRRDDVMSSAMVGPIVDLLRIRRGVP